MGRKALLQDKLQMVSGSVPGRVAAILRRMAKDESRTLSVIVRRIIEDSPAIKAALKKRSKSGRLGSG